jgi:hypothetical protein
MFACDFDYQITTNAVAEKLFVKVIEVKRESAAEVIFQITDTENESDNGIPSNNESNKTPNDLTIESNNVKQSTSDKSDEQQKPKNRKAIKTIQEDGTFTHILLKKKRDIEYKKKQKIQF